MLTNTETLMQQNPENRLGSFVEICRNIVSSLKALIFFKKAARKSITSSDPGEVVGCALIRCFEMRLKILFSGQYSPFFS